MILADTSVWADYLKHGDSTLAEMLARSMVVMHPMVIGEIALGRPHDRGKVLAALDMLPKIGLPGLADILALIDSRRLEGSGIGWVDVSLLAAVAYRPGTKLFTRDHRLLAQAGRLGLAIGDR